MVRSINGCPVISVPEPGRRTVPIVAEHADAVLRMAGRCGSGLLIPLGRMDVRKRMTWVSEVMDGPGRPRVNGHRLRTTWLHRLARRVPLADLARAAGPLGGNTLDDLATTMNNQHFSWSKYLSVVRGE